MLDFMTNLIFCLRLIGISRGNVLVIFRSKLYIFTFQKTSKFWVRATSSDILSPAVW